MAFDDLAQQIAGWERPGRAAALRALYEQACALADGPMPVEPAPPVVAPPDRPARDAASLKRFVQGLRNPTALYIAGAACVATLFAAFGVYSTFSPNRPPVVAVDTEAPSESTLPPTSSPVSQDIELKRSEARRTVRPAPAQAAAVTSGQAAPEPVDDPIVDEVLFVPVAAKPEVTPSVPLETRSVGALALTASMLTEPWVFTSDDDGVSEPVLIRPYLPPVARGGTPSEVLGVLDVLVDAHGAVETVHLRSPSNRYRERWWVFAAKQWVFQPALKNGQPVRFLKRIPLTDLNMLEPQ
jgi:hypothetical protein